MKKVKEYLLEWRTKSGLSQEAVAKKAGVFPSQYSSWERGEFDPRTSAFLAIMKVHGIEFKESENQRIRKEIWR